VEPNVQKICSQCAKGVREETQNKIASFKMEGFIGMFVKKAFTKDKKIEHMWIKVISVNENSNTLCGIIDNDPVMVDEKCGDEVVFYKEDIEEIMSNEGKLL